jgi:hypothetical protein
MVRPNWDLPPVSAGAGGDYALGGAGTPPPSPSKLIVSADGFINREEWISFQPDQRSSVTLDLIRDAAPFSLEFYRQLVRGTYDQEDAPFDVLRWTRAPKFYIKTVDQNKSAISSDVIAGVREAISRAVPAFTDGQYSATIETGTTERTATSGWINVLIKRDLSEGDTCGQAFVGQDPGEITLMINQGCSCGSLKIPGLVVVHEVGHALGFFHVGDKKSVMYPAAPDNCPAGELSADERYHSAIAYQRPRGNSDPDRDPSSGRFFAAPRVHAPQHPVKN